MGFFSPTHPIVSSFLLFRWAFPQLIPQLFSSIATSVGLLLSYSPNCFLLSSIPLGFFATNPPLFSSISTSVGLLLSYSPNCFLLSSIPLGFSSANPPIVFIYFHFRWASSLLLTQFFLAFFNSIGLLLAHSPNCFLLSSIPLGFFSLTLLSSASPSKDVYKIPPAFLAHLHRNICCVQPKRRKMGGILHYHIFISLTPFLRNHTYLHRYQV